MFGIFLFFLPLALILGLILTAPFLDSALFLQNLPIVYAIVESETFFVFLLNGEFELV